MPRFVAIAVALCLNFSLCTGGLFSVTAAMAAEFTGSEAIGGPMMSLAGADFQLCTSYTPHSGAVEESASAAGCSDGEACLAQASHASQDRVAAAFDALADAWLPVVQRIAQEIDNFGSERESLARDGPLHESSMLLAHALVKRE